MASGPDAAGLGQIGSLWRKNSRIAVGLVGRFLGEETAAVDGLAGDGLGVVAPNAENVVAATLGATSTPQH